MKKIVGFLAVTAIFIGIGFAVNRYVHGPSQPVNGIMVSGTKENISAVKNLYKDQNVQTVDYSYKLVTELIKQELTTEQKEQIKKQWKEKGENMTEEEMDKELDKPSVRKKQYAVITKSTAEKFLKKGIVRTPLSKEDSSLTSTPVKEIKGLASEKNIFYKKNVEDEEIKDGKLNLNGQMIPVQHIEQHN
ncbi:lipoprotein BA_5634 family protein, partial [Bacillus toyonensis]|nr:lipoprotein BA_5634 family protein [Bacillus toyonensis]